MNDKLLLNEINRVKQLINFGNTSINEQFSVRIAKGRGATLLNTGKKGESMKLDNESYQVKTQPQDYDKYLNEQDSTMVSLMNINSKKIWEKLKVDPEEKAYGVAALEQFNETYKEKKWDFVVVKSITTTTTQPSPEKPELPKQYPVIPFSFPSELSPNSNFFQDNYYAVTDTFKNAVKTDIVDPILEKLKQIPEPPEGKPKCFLKSMNIVTSCSTLPNGKSPDGKKYNFLLLSLKRNQAAETYIKDELSKIGVLINTTTKITRDHYGDNKEKDGTSGPKWTGKDADRPKYEQYKKLDVDLDLIFNVPAIEETDPESPDQPELTEIKSTKYKINFTRRAKKGIKIRLPKIYINAAVGRRNKRSTAVDDCPFF